MASLFKYFKRQEKPTNSSSLLTKNKLEGANKAVAKVLSEKASQGKYNSYTFVQKGEIGKYTYVYAAENGATNAVKHFSKC